MGRFAARTAFSNLTDSGNLKPVSIVTRTGDTGTTALMYGRRVVKHHPRVEAYGTVDELNAALGMVRTLAPQGFIQNTVLVIQKDLVAIMGELATAFEDQKRYATDGYPGLEPVMLQRLDQWVEEIEGQDVTIQGWAIPGATFTSAALEVARTVCRRAERRISELFASSELPDVAVLTYFNRLADLLWLMARWMETRDGADTSHSTS